MDEFAAPAGMQPGEEGMHAWATEYVKQTRSQMAAERSRGNRNVRADRAAVRRAVVAEMTNQGYSGVLFWIRVAFWVWWIMSLL